MSPFGAVEVTGINLNSTNVNAELSRIQDRLNKILKGIDEASIREILCDIAGEQISLYDIEQMSDF
jgi:hypothetical protein